MIAYAGFSRSQADYIKRSQGAWLNIAEGGKRAGKNVINLIAWAMALETHPDRLHLAAGVSQSSAKMNIIDSDGFGLQWLFQGRCRAGQYNGRDALLIRTQTGEKAVIIAGGGDARSASLIKGHSYATAYVTEVNECHKTFFQEVIDRTLASSRRQLFFDLNPKAPGHWFYADFLDFQDKLRAEGHNPYYNYGHFTIADNRSLSRGRLLEELSKYDTASIWYQRDILGKRCMPEGLVYPQFDEEKHVVDEIVEKDDDVFFISVDYGTVNPTAMGLWRVRYGYAVLEDEFYFDSKRQRRQKTDEDYYADLEALAGSRPISRVIIDPSAASFKATVQRHRRFIVRDADNEVIGGIRLVSTLLSAGRLQFHRRCCNAIREFGMYFWDTEKTTDTVIKKDDHAMDMIRYLCSTLKARYFRDTGKLVTE